MNQMHWVIFVSMMTLLNTLPASAIGDFSGLAPVLTIPEWAGSSCVEPTAVMRREHMRFLFAQRDATVRHGVRSGKHSLNGCIQCHATRDESGAPVPVNAPGQFCESCHGFAGVAMDCFECHATTPD